MPGYKVKVTYVYPVCAVNPEGALNTVPLVIKGKFIAFHGEGTTEVLDTDGKVVLTAKLVDVPKEKEVKNGTPSYG